jgi:hypothetical protein
LASERRWSISCRRRLCGTPLGVRRRLNRFFLIEPSGSAKLAGVIRPGEPAPALPRSCSALYWWCSAHWIPNCQFGNPLTSTPPAP